MIKPVKPNPDIIKQAATLLHKGKLVAFPTETVYGLGADASNPQAVAKIFSAKGRPANHPLIVHIGSVGLLEKWAEKIPDTARKLADRFWPGPLAMVLPKRPEVPLAVTGGQQTVALRIPDNPVALDLLQEFGGGIAAPSANRFNRISPTRAEHVVQELADKVDMILDGGPCQVGLESTLIDLTGLQAAILRPGQITRQQIEQVLAAKVATRQRTQTRAPGMLAVHYAPVTPALLCPVEKITARIQQALAQAKKVGVLAYSFKLPEQTGLTALYAPASPDAYAKQLYARLRLLDNLNLDLILVENVPDNPAWQAIRDRLNKATITEG